MGFTCNICGIIIQYEDSYCIHCDWHLMEGYTEDEIKEIIRKNKAEKELRKERELKDSNYLEGSEDGE